MSKQNTSDLRKLLYKKGTDGKTYYEKQPFESEKAGITECEDVKHEPSATLYLSMLTSDAWLNLSGGAIRLYHYMKMQAYSFTKNRNYRPSRDTRKLHGTEFYFNKALLRKAYPGLYVNMNQFYKDRDCLIENGFIKIVEPGTYFDRTIYDLDWRWQRVERKKKDTAKAREAAQAKRTADN